MNAKQWYQRSTWGFRKNRKTMSSCLSLTPLHPSKIRPQFCASRRRRIFTISRKTKLQRIYARLEKSDQQQLNLSVLRFTLGIPGFDESYLPRWIGYGFGSLLLLNHFFGSNINEAQFRTEALGVSLAAFSISLPYLGKFLEGATRVDQTSLPDGTEQIFVMSQIISDTRKEDLAWATYILLRNTNAVAVIISVKGELCVRGYWKTPEGVSKAHILDWFREQIEKIGLSDLKDTLYFPQSTDSELWKILPKETRSLLVLPVQANAVDEKSEGFVLLASSVSYAYSDKDRAWIGAVTNKFRGM